MSVSTCIPQNISQGSQVSLELSRTGALQEHLNLISSGCTCLPECFSLLGEGPSHCPCESLRVKGEEVLPIVAQAPEASNAPVSLKLTAHGCLEGEKAWPAPGRNLSSSCPWTSAPLRLQTRRDYLPSALPHRPIIALFNSVWPCPAQNHSLGIIAGTCVFLALHTHPCSGSAGL